MCNVLSRSFQMFKQDWIKHLWAAEENPVLEQGEINVSWPSFTFICKTIYFLWLKHPWSGVFLNVLEAWECYTRRELVIWWWFLILGGFFFPPLCDLQTLGKGIRAAQLQKGNVQGPPGRQGQSQGWSLTPEWCSAHPLEWNFPNGPCLQHFLVLMVELQQPWREFLPVFPLHFCWGLLAWEREELLCQLLGHCILA